MSGSERHVDIARMFDNFLWVKVAYGAGATLASATPAVLLAAQGTGKRIALHGLSFLPLTPTAQLFIPRSGSTVLAGSQSAPVVPAISIFTTPTIGQWPPLAPSDFPHWVGEPNQDFNLFNMTGAAVQFAATAILRVI